MIAGIHVDIPVLQAFGKPVRVALLKRKFGFNNNRFFMRSSNCTRVGEDRQP